MEESAFIDITALLLTAHFVHRARQDRERAVVRAIEDETATLAYENDAREDRIRRILALMDSEND